MQNIKKNRYFGIEFAIRIIMKKEILLLIIVVGFTSLFAQHNDNEPLEVFSEKDDKGTTVVFVKNNYLCDESVVIDFSVLKNMEVDVELPFEIVVPAETEKLKLFTIRVINSKKESALGYIVKSCHGNIFEEKYEVDYPYLLPYQKGASYRLDQGYGGAFSHYLTNKKNALDFNMPSGTSICAARGGVVLKVKDVDSKHGKTIKYLPYGNYITIYHKDGTFADYFHIQKEGSKVEVGDNVVAGQVIALSGNTGWTSGPHLHFQVYIYDENMDAKTIKTQFLQEEGELIYLKSGEEYESISIE